MKRKFVLYSILLVLCASFLTLAQAPTTPVKQAEVKSYVVSKTIEPGANLVIQNVPSIPVELADSLKKYTETIPVAGGSWHPVKREMLMGKRVGNVGQAHLLSAPLGTPKQLTNFPDPVGGGSWQPKKGDYFIFSKASGGSEVSQLFRYDVASEKITQLTTDDKKRIGGGP